MNIRQTYLRILRKSNLQKTTKIADILYLDQSSKHENPPSRLEAELILSHVLQVPRNYLYAHSDEDLSISDARQCQEFLTSLMKGVPLAYLLKMKEFWSLEFIVNPHTLIPRPETELLVEQTLSLLPNNEQLIVDLGTGCGAIATAIAVERPKWQIFATDLSFEALKVAKLNLLKHHISNVFLLNSHWCASLPQNTFDAVISNPPYIALRDPHLKALKFEPQNALVSGEDGLEALRQIIKEAPNCLKSGGWLVLEHAYDQAKAVRNLMEAAGYITVESVVDLSAVPRVTLGKWPGLDRGISLPTS